MSKDNSGWQIKKEISYGHIVTTICMFFSLVAWGVSVEKRLTTVEVGQGYGNQTLKRIENKLDRVNARLNKKVDR